MSKKRKLPKNIEQVGEFFRYNKQVDGARRQSKAHFQTPEAAQTALFRDLDEYQRTGSWPQRISVDSLPKETVFELPGAFPFHQMLAQISLFVNK